MRKVEKEVIGAFLKRRSAKVGNTSTDGSILRLFGIPIAWWYGNYVKWCMAGWESVTTRSRLNALFRLAGVKHSLCQKNGVQYLNGEVIGSNLVYSFFVEGEGNGTTN